jgi:intein/homing endonuclease
MLAQMNNMGSGGGFSEGATVVGRNTLVPLLAGFIPENNKAKRFVFEDMYYHDAVSGGVVDILSTIPFGSFDLVGIEDLRILEVYQKSVESMRIALMFPSIAREYMVKGAFVGSMLFDASEKIFTAIMPQNINLCKFTAIPFYGYDPIIDIDLPPEMKQISASKDPRIQSLIKELPADIRNNLSKGKIELSPDTTLFVPRRTLPTDYEGTSFYERALAIWIMEKTLFRGTIDMVSRRQRSIMHIQVGEGDWIATDQDLTNVQNLFLEADADPTGPIIVTRTGIMPQEVRCLSGDTYVHSEIGLIKIKHLFYERPQKDLRLAFNGRVMDRHGRMAEVSSIICQGTNKTYRVTTESGTHIDLTKNHKVKVLRGCDILTIYVDELKKTDYLYSPPSKVYNSKGYLWLWNDDTPDKTGFIPKFVSYVCAVICANGIIEKNSLMIRMAPSHTSHFIECLNYCEMKYNTVMYNDGFVTVKEPGLIEIENYSRITARFGIDVNLLKQHKHHGCVPNVIKHNSDPAYFAYFLRYLMRIDNPKYSFDADYKDGVPEINLSLSNYPRDFLFEVKLFLLNLEIRSKLTSVPGKNRNRIYKLSLDEYNSDRFLLDCDQELYNKIYADNPPAKIINKDVFIPSSIVIDAIRDIMVPLGNDQYCFNTTSGETLLRSRSLINEALSYLKNTKVIYIDGYYSKENKLVPMLLELVEKCRPVLYEKINYLLTEKLIFERVVNICARHYEQTYDLSMKNADDPYFCANGLVVSNSAEDFYRYDSVVDFATTAKYRAYGVSEELVSGQLSISTMDANLTLFVEQMRDFRNMLARTTLYDKIFPGIAYINDFTKKSYITTGEATQESIYRGFNGKYRAHAEGARPTINIRDKNVKIKDLLIPRIEWDKHLHPEGDTQYLELLDTLSQKGVPIPLTMLAAAGGVSLESIVNSQKSDLVLRKQLAEYLKKITKINNSIGGNQSESMLTALAKVNSPSTKAQGLLTREFDDQLSFNEISKKGRVKSTSPRRRAQLKDDFNAKLASVLSERASVHNARVRRRIKKKTFVDMREKPAK